MNKKIESAIVCINDLAEAVRSATGEEKPMSVFLNWTAPALNRHDLAAMATGLSMRLSRVALEELPSPIEVGLSSIAAKVASFKGNPLQHLYNAQHFKNSLPVYFALIDYIDGLVKQLERSDTPIDWEKVADAGLLPHKLVRRLRSVEARLALLDPQMEGLEEKVLLIQQAHDLAERLPSDLHDLNEARKQMTETQIGIKAGLLEIEKCKSEAEVALEGMDGISDQARQVLDRCEEAYRAATTMGLASAFNSRANELKASMRIWVCGLIAALVIGSISGGIRIRVLSELMAGSSQDVGTLVMNAILAMISLAAPIWFAWLATKQIGQRFRLAEDYSFKASVAMAYEGYRNEALKLDGELQQKLFGSALNRLDEAPLRLIDGAQHGSPWDELFESDAVKRLSKLVPDIRERMATALASAFQK